MKLLSRSKIAVTGLIVSVFVVLAGAAGYMRIVNSSAEVVQQPAPTPQKLEAPAISEASDLDKASSVLENAQLSDDLEALDSVASQL